MPIGSAVVQQVGSSEYASRVTPWYMAGWMVRVWLGLNGHIEAVLWTATTWGRRVGEVDEKEITRLPPDHDDEAVYVRTADGQGGHRMAWRRWRAGNFIFGTNAFQLCSHRNRLIKLVVSDKLIMQISR